MLLSFVSVNISMSILLISTKYVNSSNLPGAVILLMFIWHTVRLLMFGPGFGSTPAIRSKSLICVCVILPKCFHCDVVFVRDRVWCIAGECCWCWCVVCDGGCCFASRRVVSLFA